MAFSISWKLTHTFSQWKISRTAHYRSRRSYLKKKFNFPIAIRFKSRIQNVIRKSMEIEMSKLQKLVFIWNYSVRWSKSLTKSPRCIHFVSLFSICIHRHWQLITPLKRLVGIASRRLEWCGMPLTGALLFQISHSFKEFNSNCWQSLEICNRIAFCCWIKPRISDTRHLHT